MIIVYSLLFALGAIFIGLLFLGIGRKLTARLQKRYGPPFYQSFIDVIKLLSRKSITHHFVMDMGSIMGFAGLVATALFVPFAGILPFESGGPLVVILYLMPIGYLGMAMGVAASGNPLATIGISRALFLMLGYEIPFAAVLLGFITKYGTSSLMQISIMQSGGILNWHIFTMPLGFLAFETAFQAMLAEKPFDAMIAPAEIGSGPMVELSGKFLGFAFLQHAVGITIEAALMVNLFLGGASGVLEFIVKMLIAYLLAMLINGIYARYRVEEGVKFLWLYAGGLGVAQIIINYFV